MNYQAGNCRILTIFPTEGLGSPLVTSTIRNSPVRYESGRPPASTQLNRWFCCHCADGGYEDPVGMVHCDGPGDPFGECWKASCRHLKCANCALGPTHSKADIVRTVGGLHASAAFIDPVFWECGQCGEWARNAFHARCALGSGIAATPCANATCSLQWQGQHAVLAADSVVMNAHGERLGTADQSVAAAGGPWHWQRRALADPDCALVRNLRHADRRSTASMRTRDGSRVWRDGEPVPRFPYRPPPPPRSNSIKDEAAAAEWHEYECAYLAGIPLQPREGHHDGGPGPFASSRDQDSAMTPAPPPPRSFFSGWNDVQM
ncbi:hypothetical protein B0T24DRAFT_549232 [Lasiosphaeria ovina]|uniref:Uncharacterized protein n=1 Tax=Lasiosphaeria ovina TaxID=92902 RepID=A0AAE0KGL6_9PEZI|nr:hypothetical protein B0T24DRAFT_549232 [Lasiosphaeria ovina]